MNPPIPISDPADPRIAMFRHVRERDVAGRTGGFIAEGEVVLRVLARSRLYRTSAVLLAEKRVAKVQPILAAMDASVPVYIAPQAVMDSIVGFEIHRGILAFGERGATLGADKLLAGLANPTLILALFSISNHDNMGGLFRNAAAFGVDAVLLGGACCDPLYRKAIRVSVGGVFTVPFARLAVEDDPIDLLRRHGFEPLALSPAGGGRLADLAPPGRAAVLLGAEGEGLSPAILARVRTIAIPMAGGFDSLNVATTSGIVLHHLTAGRR